MHCAETISPLMFYVEDIVYSIPVQDMENITSRWAFDVRISTYKYPIYRVSTRLYDVTKSPNGNQYFFYQS